MPYTLCFIYNCSSQNYSRLMLEKKKHSPVPVPSSNPFIGCLNYTLVNLPKILSQRSLSERLGHLPAGISSLIGFQWNALNCRLEAFPIRINETRTFHFNMACWCLWRYSCVKVFTEMNTPWSDCMCNLWDGKSSSLFEMFYITDNCNNWSGGFNSWNFDHVERCFETIL